MVAEHSSCLPCKTGATVSPGEWYPELPDISDRTLPYATCSSIALVLRAIHVLPFAVPTASSMCTMFECHNNTHLVHFKAVTLSLISLGSNPRKPSAQSC